MRSSKRGFTIIEVLVVFVITAIILGVSVARYRDFSKRQEVNVATRQVISDLREAQKSAISGEKPQNVNPPCSGTLLGYAFQLRQTNAPASYRIMILCEDSGGSRIKDVTLSNNIELEFSDPTANPIFFLPLTDGTNLTGKLSITVSDASGTGASQTVSISVNGEIE